MRNLFKLKNQESQRGVAAVEFAIMLPLLLFLFIGITEFGIAYYNKQVLTNAAREGARAGVINGIDENPNKIKGIAVDYASERLISFGASNLSLSDVTLDDSDSGYLKVSIEYDYTYLMLSGFNFFGANFEPNLNIGAYTVMKFE